MGIKDTNKKNGKNDNVGEGIRAGQAGWKFGELPPEAFEEHIRRSVPYYADGHELILKLSDYFVKDTSVGYELGCSTGTLIRGLAERHRDRAGVTWIGIDKEESMIREAHKQTAPGLNIEFVNGDIVTREYRASDLIVSYYTMQFVPPHLRQTMFDKIYQSLNWGGAFLLFEKVRANDARFQDMMQTLYMDFKLERGYSGEEIVSKTRSLKGVLEPFSTEGNLGLLKRAGFVDVISVFKYICFEGFLAIK